MENNEIELIEGFEEGVNPETLKDQAEPTQIDGVKMNALQDTDSFWNYKTQSIVLGGSDTKEAMEKLIDEAIEEDAVTQASSLIGLHIYAHYPAEKQAQDEKWTTAYTTRLKAMGIENLEAEVVGMITDVMAGTPIADVVADKEASIALMYVKLIKVGVRTVWAEMCVIAGKTAIAEGVTPTYPPYPAL